MTTIEEKEWNSWMLNVNSYGKMVLSARFDHTSKRRQYQAGGGLRAEKDVELDDCFCLNKHIITRQNEGAHQLLGAFELQYEGSFSDAYIKEIVVISLPSHYFPTRARSKLVCYIRVKRLLEKNEDMLLLKRLRSQGSAWKIPWDYSCRQLCALYIRYRRGGSGDCSSELSVNYTTKLCTFHTSSFYSFAKGSMMQLRQFSRKSPQKICLLSRRLSTMGWPVHRIRNGQPISCL